MTSTRRAILASGLAALGGCVGLGGDGGGADRDTPEPAPADATVASAPLPSSPGKHTYATATASGNVPVVTYLGNWKCPFCAQFATGEGNVLSMADIVTEFVEPGDLQFRYRAVAYGSDGSPFLGPDAPRAGRAGLSVWHRAPERYWRFHETVMAHQPPESERWATVDKLVSFARAVGMDDIEGLRSDLQSDTYREEVRANTDYAAEVGIQGTPSLVVGDRVVSPFEPETARNALTEAADGG